MTNDDVLRTAYERLAAAMDAPPTVPADVPTRMRQRRRRRSWGAAAAALAVAGTATGVWALGAGDDDPLRPLPGKDLPPATNEPLAEGPDGLACATDERVNGRFFIDIGDGEDSPDVIADRFAAVIAGDHSLTIEPTQEGRWLATYRRPDGTAEVYLYLHSSEGRVYPTRLVSCPSEDPATETVVLTINHCWVMPMTVGGRDWGLTLDDQFGGGGGVPDGFIGTGEARVDGDVLHYRDYGGAKLSFVPADRPDASLEGLACM